MIPKKIIKKQNPESCWWCGCPDLSGEHKFKKKDLERLYGKEQDFKNLGISVINYRSNTVFKRLQSAKSDFAKFDKSLCSNCNNNRSQKFDLSYDELIEYYLRNEDEIKSTEEIDYSVVFGQSWKDKKINVERYLMKHIGCRLSDHGFLPFDSTIEFLNGCSQHKHLKIIIQIKPYDLQGITTLFKGPFIPISHSLNKQEITSFCGWFTMKNIAFNYIYEWNVSNQRLNISSKTPVETIDFSQIKKSFIISSEAISFDFAKIIEELEYYPFKPKLDDLNLYYYFHAKNV